MTLSWKKESRTGPSFLGTSRRRVAVMSPGRSLRSARVGTATVFAVHGAVTGNFAGRIPSIAAHVGVGVGHLGVALLMPGVGAMLAMPFSGRLVHRFAFRPLVGVTVGLWCAALVLPGLAGSFTGLCLLLVPYGAFAGVADNAMNAHAVCVEGLYGHSIMSSIHGFWSVGLLAGSGVAAVCAHLGIAPLDQFAAVAAVLIVLTGISATRLLAQPGEAGVSKTDPLVATGSAGGSEAPPLFALPSRPILLIGLVGLCAVFGEQAGTDWSALFLRNELHGSVSLAAVAVTAFAATMALIRLAGDTVVRRVGATATVRSAGVCATVGALAVAASPSVAVSLIGFGLLGGGVAVVVPLVFAAAGRVGPHPGRSIAGVAGISYGAGLAAPGVIGGVASASSLRASFGLVAALSVVIALGAGVLRPHALPQRTTSSRRT